jgi:hypothetical protein
MSKSSDEAASPITLELMGEEALVEYEDEHGLHHARLLLRPGTAKAIASCTEEEVDSDKNIFWVVTPTGDVYPEVLAVPPLRSIVVWRQGAVVRGTMTPVGRRLGKVFGFGGARLSLVPRVVVVAMNAANEEEDRHRGAKKARRVEDEGKKTSEGEEADDSEEDGAEGDVELDARVLDVKRGVDGERGRNFKDSIPLLTESPWSGWPVGGPRTFLWCVRFMAEHSLHPMAHHGRLVQLAGLNPSDPAAQEHGLLLRCMEFGITFDQLQCGELACMELIARRAQMIEMKHREKLGGTGLGNSIEEDAHIYLGTSKTRGMVMICPQLEEFAAGQLARETAAAKERRKLREERASVKAPPQKK